MRTFEFRRLLAPRSAALFLITLVTLWGGCYAWQRNAALNWIRRQNGSIGYETPHWLPREWGNYLPISVQTLRRIQVKGKDACDLARLLPLNENREFFLIQAKLDLASVRHLPRFRQLEWLFVDETAFDDEAMKWLRGCRRLKRLSLVKTLVSDAGLEHLGDLPLDELRLERTGITDAGLVFLRDLPVTKLDLCGTRITNAGLESLVDLPLSELNLERTQITDDGLRTVSKIKTLHRLTVSTLQVSIEAVKQLVAETGLESASIEVRNPGERPKYINVGTKPPVIK